MYVRSMHKSVFVKSCLYKVDHVSAFSAHQGWSRYSVLKQTVRSVPDREAKNMKVNTSYSKHYCKVR